MTAHCKLVSFGFRAGPLISVANPPPDTGLCVTRARAMAKLLKTIQRTDGSEFVFPADSGDGFFLGTKKVWPKIVKKANLVGVTPHTLRHTMGAIATSSGEALALYGAILGHAWRRLYCPWADRDGCMVSVWSTPRNAENHAKAIRRDVARCPHPGAE